MDGLEKIKEVFEQHEGVMKTSELYAAGMTYRILQKLIAEGYISKVRYGYYQWQDDQALNEAAVVSVLYPDGILCMDTALLYYDYTDRTPEQWHIAVDSRTSRTRFCIDYPEVKPHYIQTDRLGIGKQSGMIDGIPVNVYDRERVICDCLRHVNKMDGEVFNTAIQRYVRDQEKNIPRLMKYAKQLGVESKVRRTVSIWL